MTVDWSGLAPAVDAFLARWSAARQSRQLLEVVLGRKPVPNGGMVMSAELQRWVYFGRTYGLPQQDGTVARGLALAPEQLDWAMENGGPGGPVAIREGAMIGGAEQLREPTDGDVLTGAWLAQRELLMLDQAIPHYVSAAVVAEVTDAVATMEPEPLFETDLITPHGFAVFETPVIIGDLHPTTGDYDERIQIAIRALAWTREAGMLASDHKTVTPGVTMFAYTTSGDQLEWFLPSVSRAMAADGRDTDDYVEMAMEYEHFDPRAFVPSDVIPWAFGRDWTVRTEAAYVPGTVPTPVADTRRWFLAFMRLCWQEVIVRHPAQAPRHDRRRWERARPRMKDLTVLRLRRHTSPDSVETGTGAQLGYRVKVRGFWRRQFYPSLGEARLADGSMNPESHRLVWITEHWRGPEDGPMHITIPATAVIR